MTAKTPTQTGQPSKKKYVQERFMVLLTLAFVGGVVLYSTVPEGQIRGMAIGGFSILMTWLLFRFGL